MESIPTREEETTQPSTGALRTIEVALRKTVSHYQRPRVIEVLLWALIAALAALLVVLMLAAIFPVLAPFTPWILAASLAGVTLWSGFELYLALYRAPDEVEMARILQRHEPSFKHDLVSALRFGRALESGTFDTLLASPELAALHVERVARLVNERSRDGDLSAYLPTRDLRPAFWALPGVFCTALLPFLFANEWTTRTLMGDVKERLQQIVQLEETEKRPVMGNLSLRIRPPEYTGLAEQFELFTTGNATVVEGTYISFDGFVLPVRATRVELVIEQVEPAANEDGEPVPKRDVRSVEMYGDGRGKGGFVARGTMKYWFQAVLEDGTRVEEATPRTIEVKPDQVPQVSIVSHDGELEVSTDDVIDLQYSARDDFGLTEMARISVFEGSDKEKRVPLDLPALTAVPIEQLGSLRLDLSEFNLQPRDRLIVFIEAVDNNTLTGPGIGRSTPLVLYVSSPDDRHFKNMDAQRELVEALFLVLADYLEAPLGERVVDDKGSWSQFISEQEDGKAYTARFKKLGMAHQGATKVYDEMGKLVTVLEQDPLMVERDLTLFKSLYEQLAKQHKQGTRQLDRLQVAASQDQLTRGELDRLARWSSEHEEALEKGILRLEDLLFSQQARNVEATMEEIDQLKERLKELLERYKETGDPELKEAIMREIQRLRSRMAELSRRMQSQIQQLPAEHVNREAIEQKQMESAASKVANDFNSLEDLLEKGDIDGALEALDKMGQNLDEMQEMVSEQFGNAQPEALSEFDKKMSELIDDANDLNELQSQLEQDTKELQEEIQKEEQEEIAESLKELKKELSSELETQKKALQSSSDRDLHRTVDEARREALEATEKIQRSLDANDVESALQQAESALEKIEEMRFQAQMRKRFKRQGPERQAIERLDQKAPAMRRRGDRIAERLADMMDEASAQAERVDPRSRQLAERQQKIEQRAQEIQQKIEDASGQYPGLKEQLEGPMKQSQKAMKDAEKGLGERRMQRALDSERKAIEQLRQLKESMQDSVKKERQKSEKEGPRGVEQKNDKPDLSGDARRRPAYRDMIQDGMKEDRLEEYESEIDRYYESLSK